ncbi:MAG: glycerol acyltransferase [Gammaproteobacteria bacterium]|nr:glycerol acyltransferase [Gammaproteobacteria bacterium]
MSFSLLGKRRFGPFFITQFLGAFNDNLFKQSLIVLITFIAVSADESSPAVLANAAAALFILPFFLFSASAGQLADMMDKAAMIRRIKIAEVAIMMCAAIGFLLDSLPLLLAVLFAMGTQSAFFGPVKYGLLPQHLREDELVPGNGLVEMGTFAAILLGTILGGLLITMQAGIYLVSAALIAVAVVGWLGARAIPKAPAMAAGLTFSWNFLTETWRILRFTRSNETVFNSILGISWFWFYGATLLAQLPIYVSQNLHASAPVFTLLLTVFSLGIGTGSLLCERLSGRLVEIGLVPFGAIGLTVFCFDFYLATPELSPDGSAVGIAAFLAQPYSARLLFDLSMLSLFGGFFIVPLYALVQLRSPVEKRSRIIAGNNILNALFMVLSALMAIGLLAAGLSVPQLFLVLALMNAAVSIYIFTLVPEFLMRFIVWLLIHTIYRLRIRDIENIPDTGPCVLVCNHVSFVDALVIAAACRRPTRFVMEHNIFALPVINFVFRVGGAIPIAPRRVDPQMIERAFDRVAQYLKAGEIVCIFPEGKITSDGEMNVFRSGIERIVERTPVPVVPLALRGLFGSFFSREGGAAMSRPLRLITRFRSSIELVAAAAVPASEVSADGLQSMVAALRGRWR